MYTYLFIVENEAPTIKNVNGNNRINAPTALLLPFNHSEGLNILTN
jgi:hypothetical protein